MEELIEKKIKKYKIISIIGSIVLLALIIFQIWYISGGDDSCSGISYSSTMIQQEIDAFNRQFDSYQGEEVSGSNVKALLSKLIANSRSFADEPDKVPNITATIDMSSDITSVIYDSVNNETNNAYIDGINKIRNAIIIKDTYTVEMEYSESTGLIKLIKITKFEDNKSIENNTIGNSIVVELD